MSLFGQRRVRRRRAHHQHVVVGVDVRRGDRRARAGVAGDELDLLADDEIGHRDRLLGIAGVVLDDDLDLAALDAAGFVDRSRGGFPAAFLLFADRRDRTRHRTDDGDRDVLRFDRRGGQRQREPCQRQDQRFMHVHALHIALQPLRAHARLCSKRAQRPFLPSCPVQTKFAPLRAAGACPYG